jgi:hypothetical protein
MAVSHPDGCVCCLWCDDLGGPSLLLQQSRQHPRQLGRPANVGNSNWNWLCLSKQDLCMRVFAYIQRSGMRKEFGLVRMLNMPSIALSFTNFRRRVAHICCDAAIPTADDRKVYSQSSHGAYKVFFWVDDYSPSNQAYPISGCCYTFYLIHPSPDNHQCHPAACSDC